MATVLPYPESAASTGAAAPRIRFSQVGAMIKQKLHHEQPAPDAPHTLSGLVKQLKEKAQTLVPASPTTPTAPRSGNARKKPKITARGRIWYGVNEDSKELEKLHVASIIDESCWNPLDFWKFAYLRYCGEVGGKAARNAINSTLTTLGIVGALISQLVLAGLDQTPTCPAYKSWPACNDFPEWQTAYITCMICALCCSLFCVLLTITAQTWFAVYKDDEMVYFITRFYAFAIATPIMLICFAVVLVVFNVTFLLFIVFEFTSVIVFVVVASMIGGSALTFIFYVMTQTLRLRRARWGLTEREDDQELLRNLGSHHLDEAAPPLPILPSAVPSS